MIVDDFFGFLYQGIDWRWGEVPATVGVRACVKIGRCRGTSGWRTVAALWRSCARLGWFAIQWQQIRRSWLSKPSKIWRATLSTRSFSITAFRVSMSVSTCSGMTTPMQTYCSWSTLLQKLSRARSWKLYFQVGKLPMVIGLFCYWPYFLNQPTSHRMVCRYVPTSSMFTHTKLRLSAISAERCFSVLSGRDWNANVSLNFLPHIIQHL